MSARRWPMRNLNDGKTLFKSSSLKYFDAKRSAGFFFSSSSCQCFRERSTEKTGGSVFVGNVVLRKDNRIVDGKCHFGDF